MNCGGQVGHGGGKKRNPDRLPESGVLADKQDLERVEGGQCFGGKMV